MKQPYVPTVQEFGEAIGIKPLSSMSVQCSNLKYKDKFLIVNGAARNILLKKQSIKTIAKSLNTTEHVIKKMIQHYRKGGIDAINSANWGRGGYRKNEKPITENQKQWAASYQTLRSQIGLSLNDRRFQFNNQHNLNISLKRFRKMYKNLGIRKQQLNQRIGAPKMKPYDIQMDQIIALQKELKRFEDSNYEILALDESWFNPDSYKFQHWMNSSEPIQKTQRLSGNISKISVCCVISKTFGNILSTFLADRYHNSEDMCQILQELRLRIGQGVKIMLFMDNASHHKSEKTREFAQREDIDIELLFYIPYRCDFNPVELVYRQAKYNYAKELEIYKANNQKWDQMETVQYIMDQLPQKFIQKQASKLHSLIFQGQPTIPIQTEQQIHLGFIDNYASSPERPSFYEQFDYGQLENEQ